MNGTYKYKHQTYVDGIRTYVDYSMRVTVVAERANKYQVKYHGQHAGGAAIGSLHWVRKDKVKLDDFDNGSRIEFKGLPDNYRLPYKD